jgi:hypothetical protein
MTEDGRLAPIVAALRSGFGTSTRLPGLAPDLVVGDPAGWTPVADLCGPGVEGLLKAARERWDAPDHIAAAVTWKAYSYWLAVPAVLGWMSGTLVPHLSGAQVLVRFDDPYAPVTLGLRPGIPVSGPGDEPVVALLGTLRRTLLDEHVTPLLAAIGSRTRLGRRVLLGSLAAAVVHVTIRAAGPAADPSVLLAALGLTDLVEWQVHPAGRVLVRRKTCCLAFTLPRPKICGDCCLRPER